MATQTWTNIVPDPKVVQPADDLNPTISRNWTWGGGWYGGQGVIVTSGGPAGVTPRFMSGDLLAESGSAGAVVTYQGPDAIPFTIGQRITVQMWAWSDVPSPISQMSVLCFDASDNILAHVQGPSAPAASGAWEPRSLTFSVPAGTSKIVPSVAFEYIGDNNPHEVRGTALTAVPSVDGADYTGPYFDGDTPDVPGVATYSWAGLPDNSASLLSLTVADPEPQPQQSSAQVVPIPNPVIPRVLKPLHLKGFSVQEDSTPIYASDMSGGAGAMTLEVDENGDTPYLLNAEIDLIDPAQGTTRGSIKNLSSDNTNVSLVADSRQALLNVNRNAAAAVGTLEDALVYYFDLCGMVDGFVIEETIKNIPVKFLGFSGNVWEELKKMAPALGIEFTLVSNNIVARPIRQNISENYRDSSRSWSYDTAQRAQQVDIYKYTTSTVSGGLIYNGYESEQTPMSVEAGATVEFIIPFEGSVISINQPVYLEDIGPGDPGFSAYNAVGQDNLPIPKAQWEAQGGALTVAVSDDSRSIVVTVTAPYETQYSPYRIGVSDGDTVYSTLRLHGSAILYTKELHSYHTAVDPDQVSQEVGATIDNPYIQTEQQLLDVAMGELRYWGGNRRTINVTTNGINRLSDNGSYAYATFEDFDSWWDGSHPGATFDDFDTEAPPVFGGTFGEHDKWWIEEVQNDFANQAFGNIAGARVRTESNFHRIRTATTTESGISYTAWEDSVFGDHDAIWGKINPPLGSIRNRIGNPDVVDGGTPFVANDSTGSYVPDGFYRSASSSTVSQQSISPTPPAPEAVSGRWSVVGGESQAIRVLYRSTTAPATPRIRVTPYAGSSQEPFSTSDAVVVGAGDTALLEYRFVVDPDVTSIKIEVGAGAISSAGITFDAGQWAFFSGADADALDPLEPIPFFSGSTPSTSYADYAWAGNPNESPTVRTELDPATFADFDAHWFGRAFIEFDATPLEGINA